MVVNNIRNILVNLGLSDYEARAYLCLLDIQPATASEIARETAIPSSKIYELMSRLIDKGLFIDIDAGQTRSKQYCALSAEDFVARKQAEVTSNSKALLAEIRKPKTNAGGDLIWPLADANAILVKSKQLINQSANSLLISLWPQELDELEEDLRLAEQRGVRIALVHFGQPERNIGATYYHPAEQTLYEEKQGRGFTLVVDSSSVVIATFDQQARGNWSENPTFVTVAEDYVRHDVYITKVTTRLNPQVVAEFGENYEQLRDVFNP